MKKIYAVPLIQEGLINKYCFRECGKVKIGGLIDPVLGACVPCDIEDCPYEEENIEVGMSNGMRVFIRKLTEKPKNNLTPDTGRE